MGFYKNREDYVRSLSIGDPDVAHLQEGRQSFFRINDVEEILEACTTWIHFPCFVQLSLAGMDVNKGGSIRQVNSNSWMFLSNRIFDETDEDNSEAAAISRAYELTFNVMQRYKRKLYDDSEDSECWGEIEFDRFKWEQVGPFGDLLYGWVLTFTDETRPGI